MKAVSAYAKELSSLALADRQFGPGALKEINMITKHPVIGVIGSHDCDAKVEQIAHNLGKNIAKVGAKLVCGGLGGVMEAVCKGMKEENGITIGIIPSYDKKDANKYVDIVIPTGLGYARNVLVVQAADIIIALPGEYGTLSEIAYALQFKKPVINLGNWDIPGTIKAKDVDEAIKIVSKLINN